MRILHLDLSTFAQHGAALGILAFGCVTPVAAQTTTPSDGWVALPIDEYKTLRDKANPRPAAPAQGAASTLTRVDYELTVDGDTASGRALLTIDVLGDAWARVPIPVGLIARSASVDGQPVALIAGPAPYVLLSRSGRTVLTLEIAVPLVTSAGAESIVLPPTKAPVSRVALLLPKSGVNLSAGDGFIAEHVESPTNSQWTVFAKPQQPLTLAWKRRGDDRRAEQPLRLRARINEVVALGEDGGQLNAAVRLDVLQGLAREVILAVPADAVVTQVDGPTVADWSVVDAALRVRFLDPVAAEVSFVVQADAKVPRDGLITIPLLRVPSAERETGGVGVDIVGAGELTQRQVRNLDPADPSELGEVTTGRVLTSLVAFRARPVTGADTRALTVNVVRYSPQAVLVANVEEARYRALLAEDGRELIEGRYAVRNNQRSFLKVTLPEGATLWSAAVGERPVRPGVAEGSALLLPLEKARASEEAPTFVVSLVYLRQIPSWARSGRATLTLPALDLPVSRTGVELYYSPQYRVDVVPGSFRREDNLGIPADALRQPSTRDAIDVVNGRTQTAAPALQSLVDRFRNEVGGHTVVGSLPVNVSVPSFGPVLFLGSELAAESTSASAELMFTRVAK